MTDAQTENANHLRTRFAREVLRRAPDSVLDVGCGRGALLFVCRQAGVAASGIETDIQCRDALIDAGFPLLESIEECGDATFDWVTMRHVPHHLPDPRAAIEQAFRVCKSGVIVAEPWFDRTDPAQAVADDLDNWIKREHRRQGHFHAKNMTFDELVELVPKHERLDTQWEHYVKPRERPLENVTSEAKRYLAKLPKSGEEAQEYAALIERANSDGLACNGSMMITFARRKD